MIELAPTEPPRDCPLCPRLVTYREEQRAAHPGWHNAPVAAFGDPNAWLAIVGPAPVLQGSNRTGRPLLGDRAAVLLRAALERFELSADVGEDGVVPDLHGVVIVDAVRCAAPLNRPTPEEIRTCRPFLAAPLAALPALRIVVALGDAAHKSAVKALGGKLPKAPFAHLAEHRFPSGIRLIDSDHWAQGQGADGAAAADMLDAVLTRALAMRMEDAAPA